MKLTLKGALNISSLKNAQLILDQKEKTLTEIPIFQHYDHGRSRC